MIDEQQVGIWSDASTLPLTDAVEQQREYGRGMFITSDNVDPELAEPYIDIDEQRTTTDPATETTVAYRYIHGGFTGTAERAGNPAASYALVQNLARVRVVVD